MRMTGNEDRFTGKILWRLWAPAMISSVGLALADIADAVVVGQRMGVTGLATISICLPIYMVLNIFMHSLGQGGSIRFAKLMGAGRQKEATDCFNRVMAAGLLVSVCIALFGNVFLTQVLAVLGTTSADGALFASCRIYGGIILAGAPAFFLAYMGNYFLMSDGCQKLAGAGFIVANAVDIALNVLLVLVLDLGVAGAAAATVAGMLVVDVMYIPAYAAKDHFLHFRIVKPDVREVWECFRTGFAVGISYIFQFIFLLVANNLLLRMAGALEVAVFDMLQNASYLILYLYEGARKAMTPLVSTYVGEKNRGGEKRTLILTLCWTSLAGAAMTGFFFFFPQTLCALFGLHGAAETALGVRALRIYCAGALFAGVNVILEGYYQACGREKNAYALANLRGAFVLLPATFLFLLLDVAYFWWLFFLTEALTLLLFFLWQRRFGEKEDGIAQERVYQRTIVSRNEDLAPLMDGVEQFCAHFEASGEQQYFVTMTVEEICAAIIAHGFEEREGGCIQITLIALENKDFELHIRDSAKSFNPFGMGTEASDGEPDLDAMGMQMIREMAKDFFYRKYQGFNSLVVWI